MLKHRLITGTVLIGALCAAVFWQSHWAGLIFGLMAFLFISVALQEFSTLSKKISGSRQGQNAFTNLMLFLGCFYVILIAAFGFISRSRNDLSVGWLSEQLFYVNLIFPVLLLVAALFLLMWSKDFKDGVVNLVYALAAWVYLIWPLGFMLKIYYLDIPDQNPGPFLLFFVIMVTKAADIGGYTVGKISHSIMDGNHKLIPKISPGKSWEGLCGSLLFSAGLAALLIHLHGPVAIRQMSGHEIVLLDLRSAAIIGACLALIGLLGDLTASVLKRAAEVKDSGTLVPGLGGMIDTLDSLIPAGPVFFVYLTIMQRIIW